MSTGNGTEEPALKTDLELRVSRLEIKTTHHDALIKAEQDATKTALTETKQHMSKLHEDSSQMIGQLADDTAAGLSALRSAIADVSKALSIVARDMARRKKQPAARRRKGA